MEGMFLHGAAHIFFENKLAETEGHFNTKFKKFEQMFRDEMHEMSKHHTHEIKKIKNEVKLLREEVSEIRRTEEDLSVKGMDKIGKLTKEVKTEVNEIKKIKYEVNQLKNEVSGIRQSEEDLSSIGMDQISKLGKEFKGEIKQLKDEIKVIEKNVVIAKEIKKSNQEIGIINLNQEDNNQFEPGIQENHDKEQKENIKPQPIYGNLSTIIESSLSSEEEPDLPMSSEKGSDDGEDMKENNLKENGHNLNFEHTAYQSQDMRNFNDDHVRRMVFTGSSQDSSESDESDAVSDDDKTAH